MMKKITFQEFFFPKLTSKFFLRVFIVSLSTYFFFFYFITPIIIKGKSMEPTLKDGSIHFLCKICLLFEETQRGDIVGIKLAGRKVILLKRVVAFEGEIVEFKDGKLFIDGKEICEPYIIDKSDWNYEGKIIDKGKVFVVGDNRGVPIESHDFGEVSKKRIVGKMIW